MVIWLCVLVAASLALFAIHVLRRIPRQQILSSDDLKRLELETELHRTVLQALGGVAVIAGVAISWVTAKSAWDTLRQDGARDAAEGYSRAVDHLGRKDLMSRVAAVYELGGMADYSALYERSTVELLTTYVRQGANRKTYWPAEVDSIAEDTQAIAFVLGARRRPKDAAVYEVNLRNAYLANANFNPYGGEEPPLRGADFSGAVLVAANLTKADLRAAEFSRAILIGAQLAGARLDSASVENADLRFVDLGGTNAHGLRNWAKARLDSALVVGLEPKTLRDSIQAKANVFVDRTAWEKARKDHWKIVRNAWFAADSASRRGAGQGALRSVEAP